MYPKGNLLIPAAHGHLEGIYRPPADPVERVALVLHPHPLFGGTMHNKVVYRTARALEESASRRCASISAASVTDGEHDKGRVRIDDASIALEYLIQHQVGRQGSVAGFSFGAAVGLRLGCEDGRVDNLLAIGTPLRLDGLSYLDPAQSRSSSARR